MVSNVRAVNSEVVFTSGKSFPANVCYCVTPMQIMVRIGLYKLVIFQSGVFKWIKANQLVYAFL